MLTWFPLTMLLFRGDDDAPVLCRSCALRMSQGEGGGEEAPEEEALRVSESGGGRGAGQDKGGAVAEDEQRGRKPLTSQRPTIGSQ